MKLNEYLDIYRITKKEFAEYIKADPVTIWKVCKGKQVPGLALMRKINLATGEKVSYEDYTDMSESILPIIPADMEGAMGMYVKIQSIEASYKSQIDELKEQISKMQELIAHPNDIQDKNIDQEESV